MAGILDLEQLLSEMSPELMPGSFVFVTFPAGAYGMFAEFEPIGVFQEREGLTLIMPQANADEHEVAYEGVYRMITLNVHSSLEAVGLTAAFATRLAEHGISANVMAGYYHDHIFIPAAAADNALAALSGLTKS